MCGYGQEAISTIVRDTQDYDEGRYDDYDDEWDDDWWRDGGWRRNLRGLAEEESEAPVEERKVEIDGEMWVILYDNEDDEGDDVEADGDD